MKIFTSIDINVLPITSNKPSLSSEHINPISCNEYNFNHLGNYDNITNVFLQ